MKYINKVQNLLEKLYVRKEMLKSYNYTSFNKILEIHALIWRDKILYICKQCRKWCFEVIFDQNSHFNFKLLLKNSDTFLQSQMVKKYTFFTE